MNDAIREAAHGRPLPAETQPAADSNKPKIGRLAGVPRIKDSTGTGNPEPDRSSN
jgi:hypothetical protein